MPFSLGTVAKQYKRFPTTNLTWTSFTTIDVTAGISNIKYNGSEYIASVGSEGRVYRSTNLTTWTSVINVNYDSKGTPTYTGIQGIIWTGKFWFIGSELYTQVRHSTNGINWTTSINDPQGSIFGRSALPMEYLNDSTMCVDTRTEEAIFLDRVAAGTNILKTTNGVSWTTHLNVGPAIACISFANNAFYGTWTSGGGEIAEGSPGANYLLTSTNAINWTTANNQFSFSGPIYYDGIRYLHFNQNSSPYLSTNSISWTTVNSNITMTNDLRKVVNRYVLTAKNSIVDAQYISNNLGYTWTTITGQGSISQIYEFNGFLYLKLNAFTSSLYVSNNRIR